MSRIVIVTHRTLEIDSSGSFTYLRMLMEQLSADNILDILCVSESTFSNFPFRTIHKNIRPNGDVIWLQSIKLGRWYISTSWRVWFRLIKRAVIEFVKKLPIDIANKIRIKSNLAYIPPERELKQLAALIRRRKPDYIIVEYSSLAPLYQYLDKEDFTRVVLMHDSFAGRTEQFKQQGEAPDLIELSFNDEVARLKNADIILHASELDRKLFLKELLEAQHVWFCPPVVSYRSSLKKRQPGLYYIGTNHKGNRDALMHFIDAIFPIVREALPEVKLLVVGTVGNNIPDNYIIPGVELLGRIDHLSDYTGPDLIGLAPTRLASGISIKVAEYLGLGMPSISYPTGIDGFGGILGKSVISVNSPKEFAKACIELLKDADLREGMSNKALDTAETKLSDPGITKLFSNKGV